jgi:ABC-2 type transport system ATP-binding protein
MTGLSVQSLTYAYGPKTALDAVSFDVPPATFCALLGPNGAGKSTLFALLTRLFTARQGRITIAGHDLSREPRAALARMGVVFQQPTLDLDLTVRRNLLYFAALHGIAGREADTRAAAALERLGMADRAQELARNLNGGHRRRMEIARALIHRPPSSCSMNPPSASMPPAARPSPPMSTTLRPKACASSGPPIWSTKCATPTAFWSCTAGGFWPTVWRATWPVAARWSTGSCR